MKTKSITIAFIVASALGIQSSQAALLITQYYEGSSFNKWIEITNTGGSSVDLAADQYRLSIWQNANTEAYKTNGTPSQTLALTGTIASGQTLLYSHASATIPGYATADFTNSTVINHNGDDSFTLWTGAVFSTASIVDAIGFTDVGTEGADNSFVRLTSDPGWNTTAGSNVDDFPSVWGEFTNTEVDDALTETEERLGFSSLSSTSNPPPTAPIPEPSTALLGAIGALMLLRRRR